MSVNNSFAKLFTNDSNDAHPRDSHLEVSTKTMMSATMLAHDMSKVNRDVCDDLLTPWAVTSTTYLVVSRL